MLIHELVTFSVNGTFDFSRGGTRHDETSRVPSIDETLRRIYEEEQEIVVKISIPVLSSPNA